MLGNMYVCRIDDRGRANELSVQSMEREQKIQYLRVCPVLLKSADA